MDIQDEPAEDERTDEPAALVEAALPESVLTGLELPSGDADFIVTKEHRRFTEFAAAVRRNIGNHRYPNVLNDHLWDTCAA